MVFLGWCFKKDMSNVEPTTIQCNTPFLKNYVKSFLSMKIKLWRIGVLLILLCAGLIISIIIYEQVTKPIFENFKYGMTMQEVQAIMGRPFIDWDKDGEAEWSYNISERGDQVKLHFYDGKLIKVDWGKGSPKNLEPDIEKETVFWSEIIRLNPKDSKAYRRRGLINGCANKFDDAIADFTEAIRIDSNNPATYHARAAAYRSKGEIEKAVADAAKGEEIKKSSQN